VRLRKSLNNGINWNIPLEEFRYEFEVVLASQRRARDIANICALFANENDDSNEKNKRRRRLLLFLHHENTTNKKREKRWEDSCDESKTWTFGRKSSSCEWTIT
jgi:hypothetical protein